MTIVEVGTADYVRSTTANSKASPVQDIDLFYKIFDEAYEQFQKRAFN